VLEVIYSGGVSTGVGLIILAVIFTVGVVLFTATLLIGVLPGALLAESLVSERRRKPTPPPSPTGDETTTS